MKDPKIYIDENPITKKRLDKYMIDFGRELPDDYQSFLLEFNGGAIYEPSTAYVWRFPINRFLSLGDLELQEKTNCGFNDWEWMSDDDNLPDNHQSKELLPIAICDQGTIMLSLKEETYGNIYHSHYTGGEGVEKGRFNSFQDLLNNYKIPENETPTEASEFYYANRKLFDSGLFITREKPEVRLERFKEVYQFSGDPNFKEPEPFNTTLLQHYLHWRPIFQFLVTKGANTEGLYIHTSNFEMIKYLYSELGLDINKPYNGYYPIIAWSSVGSTDWDTKIKKELMDKLFDSDLDIDWSIKDKNGNTIKERYEKLKERYDKKWN